MAGSIGIDIRTLIQDGGFIMWPLIACSVLGTIVLVERTLALAGERRASNRLADLVIARLRSSGREAARVSCEDSRSPFAPVLAEALAPAAADRAAAAVERARAMAGQELRVGLWILGTIGAAAPFVGLFGTVLGIIKSFQEMAATGKSGFATVAAGISEALIATGSGIAVAVIAFAAHNALQAAVGSLTVDWRVRSEEVLDAVEDFGAPPASPPAEEAPRVAGVGA